MFVIIFIIEILILNDIIYLYNLIYINIDIIG